MPLKKLRPYGRPKSKPGENRREDAFFVPVENKGRPKPPKHGGFEVFIPGDFVLQPGEKDALVKKAHEEFYHEWLGEKPADGMSCADMRDAIEARAGKKMNIKIVPVRMNPDDRVGSFILHMEQLDTFFKESRTRLVADAIKELAVLGQTASKFGDEISSNKFELCRALLKMQKADRETSVFDDDHDAALNALRSNPNLRQAFRSAERNLLKSAHREASAQLSTGNGQPSAEFEKTQRRDSAVSL